VPVISLTRRHLLVTALVLVAVLALVGKRLAGAGATQPSRPAAAITPLARAAPARVVVHVVGAVRRPGLYRLPDTARVADAVSRAGGATRRAELTGVNLAAPLVDGAQIVVPTRLPVGAAGVPTTAAPSPTKVSLAVATMEQLDGLPGVGPVTAQKILDYRAEHGPFRSVDDLDGVPGIGPATVDELRDLVTP
jgi:competence protein ComEA